jgi:hypothetical protein
MASREVPRLDLVRAATLSAGTVRAHRTISTWQGANLRLLITHRRGIHGVRRRCRR